jgi:hypothetical protein
MKRLWFTAFALAAAVAAACSTKDDAPGAKGAGGSGGAGTAGQGGAPGKPAGEFCTCDDECSTGYCAAIDASSALCTPPGASRYCSPTGMGNSEVCFQFGGRRGPCAASGGTAGSGGAAGAGASAGTGSGGSAGAPPGSFDVTAIGANTTVGLEWNAAAGVETYNVYWSTTPGVTKETGQLVSVTAPNWVHRGLVNGTAHYYIVTAVSSGIEGAPSTETSATPTGEWALEEFGTGIIDDVRTGSALQRVPIDKRLHILLFGEGYTAADLAVLHDVGTHDSSRANDVDRWVDLVFGIEPYRTFRQAFVVWYLPRASSAHIGGDTAFDVPTIEGPGVGSVAADGETARLAWEAINAFPYPPTDFAGPSNGTARNVITPFMIFDPTRGRASVSGRALSLRNPANTGQRVSAAFGVGHAHEFTHAFSSLRDEYLEDDNTAPGSWSGTSNVVGSASCSELPWQHLLAGGAINASRDQLVGAFGRPQHGYHSELLCLLNGTHDNAAYYGGSGLLRVEDRMCNFCREITAFRVYQRGGVLASGDAGFATWVADYRSAFYSRFPFAIPAVVPQTNDVRNPSQGAPVYEACSGATAAALSETAFATRAPRNGDRRPAGCVLDPE